MNIRRILVLITAVLAALTVSAATYSVKQIPNVQVADSTRHLSNPDGIVSPTVAAQIDQLLLDARHKSSAEIVAVIVDDIDSDDIDSFATELFNTWRIGKKDKNNGILLIVAKDSRQATIRTGYGAEGVLPDIIAGRIVYDVMIPHFRDGDYEGGMLAGVKAIHRIATDPEAAAELKSALDDERSDNDIDVLYNYLKVGGVVAVGMLVWLLVVVLGLWRKGKNISDYQKYLTLGKYQLPMWVISLIFVGIPILAPILLWFLRRHLRNHSRKCPHCHTQMRKLDEDEDNKYLNEVQDLEERLNSVDYDVWLCPKCGEKDIYSFVNEQSNYKECQLCHAHTVKLAGTRIIKEPTYQHEGIGEKQYVCLNCQNRSTQRYKIAKKEPPVTVLPLGGGGGRGFGGGGFGGGFGGGGFGGGLTGGGGATGRW